MEKVYSARTAKMPNNQAIERLDDETIMCSIIFVFHMLFLASNSNKFLLKN